jgi:Kef-type K+ transport system membrane component KefB
LSATSISPETFLAIIAVSAVAGTLCLFAGRAGIALPVVVLELVAGVLLGPHVLGLKISNAILLFKDLGLGLLFFFAGFELDFRRIKGKPLELGMLGWVVSLGLAYVCAAVLHAAGIAISVVYFGSALATTAVGALIPILSDSGELRTRFGTLLLAAGAAGEFGPILLLTLVLSTQSSLHNALILLAFVAITVVVALSAVRSSGRTLPAFQRTLEASSQLAVRWVLVLVFALALLAYRLGLDLLLGGFAAGLIAQEVLRGEPMPQFESKLSGIAFGVFVPFFFVVSGMGLRISSFGNATGIYRTLLYLGLMLFVRGMPALLLYRSELAARDRVALALMSATQLPLVLAITAVATAVGKMTIDNAADLVGAAALSTLIFPLVGLRLRRDALSAAALAAVDSQSGLRDDPDVGAG